MTAARDRRITLLAGAARALAEELGYDVGVALMLHFGGQQISVPARPLGKWIVRQKLGLEAARVLCRRYGVTTIEVPTGKALRSAEQQRLIRQHPGSHNEAARAAGVTRRWVRMVRKGATAPLPLFDGLSKRP